MLSRIVRIPIKYSFSAAARQQFNNVPQTVKEVRKQIQEWGTLRQQSSLSDLGQYAINFVQEVNGKKLVLQSLPQVRTGFNLPDVTTALFSMGTAYGILSNFNYVLTLGMALGALASNMTAGRVNLARNQNIITAIQVDTNQRLHITYLGDNGYDSLIVDKRDFTYNVLRPGSLGTNAIWCTANNQDFWISRANLQINNQQIHHLL